MSYGIEFVPGNLSVKQVVNYCKLAETKDIDYAWITNHYNNRHCYPILAAIAQATDEIKMGPGIMNAFTDTPAAMASFSCTLNEISDGRAILGIGPGDLSTLPKLAIDPSKPVSKLKEAVIQIRALCAGEEVNKQGLEFFDYDGAKLTGVQLPGKKGIPIYIGAQGPKVLELAGEMGDGALINASNPKDFEAAIPIINAACEKVGKKKFDIGAYTAISVDDDVKKARNAAKIVAAFIAAGSPPAILERHNLDMGNVEKIKAALSKFDFKTVGGLVGDAEIDAFTIAGTPDDVKQKCDDLVASGVTQVIFGSPLGPDMVKSIRLLGKYVV
ncbi:MAG: 5,10-methylenetetrahydromethanopterin reductase [Methanocalculus sp. MSAO_Arc1]|uniref:5,10-methylenetetrahydromethanopterin reductase n=1 Tax=Methanocalculus TaxID=71151 RepID=UPI000FED37FA|nr:MULTISPECIES: 5,10-methylenetetrahydromethanopterin reductase [unclassified Methanocalculus]MCP1662974.1 5,10-methylenetetrahydromethanopterin reductase [Methanocalculus sp. AMF5]RQD80744.1 MAG: 5,10-methylenetetrahydromethanopterin reductase [Methanocalculus sp. MSAO_Arc1]